MSNFHKASIPVPSPPVVHLYSYQPKCGSPFR
jgi:hypothetical protein